MPGDLGRLALARTVEKTAPFFHPKQAPGVPGKNLKQLELFHGLRWWQSTQVAWRSCCQPGKNSTAARTDPDRKGGKGWRIAHSLWVRGCWLKMPGYSLASRPEYPHGAALR